MDEEIKAEILAEVQSIRAHLELHIKRVDRLEDSVIEHHLACKENKAEIKEMLEMVRAINHGMRITNVLRNAVLWLGGLATTIYSLVQIGKEYLK